MTLATFACTRCNLLLELDPPEVTAAGWYAVKGAIVCPGCVSPHDRMHAPPLADAARDELLRRFRERRN